MAAGRSGSRVLDKKLSKVLEMKTDSPQMIETLTALSSFYGKDGNTLEARRALRSDLEKRNLAIAHEFIRQLEGVVKQLEDVERNVAHVQNSYHNICSKIKDNESATSEILKTTETLQLKRDDLNERANRVDAFLLKFQLSSSQKSCLYDEPIAHDGAFFEALLTVQRIKADCALLIGTEHQSAGMELLEEMSVHQERGFDRLYKWVQEEVKKIVQDTPDIEKILRVGVRLLGERQAYYRHCQELFVTTRRNALVKRFILALTRGGPNGTPRPMELSSHDSMRYAGDMLAWVHQAVASEKDLFMSLYASRKVEVPTSVSGATSGTVTPAPGSPLRASAQVEDMPLFDEVFTGIVRPLSVRIEQMLSPQIGVVLAYKLSNLLTFYSSVITTMLGGDTPMSTCIQSLENRATSLFQELMNSQIQKLASSPSQYPSDLSPPHGLVDIVSRLGDILVCYNNSMAAVDEKATNFTPILDSIYDPLLAIADSASEGLDRNNKCVFLVNIYQIMQQVLLPFDFVAEWVTRLAGKLDGLLDALILDVHDEILKKCGVATVVHLIRDNEGKVLSTIEGLDAASLQDAVRSFTNLLFALVTPQFDKIISPKYRNTAKAGLARAAATTYEELFIVISKDTSGYSNVEAIFMHRPDQVKTLLDVA